MKTIQKRELKLRIPVTLCLSVCLFFCLNGAAYCGIADTIKTQPRKAPIPLNLPLSGTVNGNQYQKGSKIVSTQSIESGKTTYLAEEEVVLNEGFEVMDGAEFEVMIDRDSFFVYTFLTYNLSDNLKYDQHADVINASKADVVSLQEVRMTAKFSHLKNKTNLDGEMKATVGTEYGIGILWNPKTVGSPLDKDQVKLSTPDDKYDSHRAYIVAEFRDFCFVATHYSTNSAHRETMTNKILGNTLVQKCQNSGKPVYVAGDMNARPTESPIQLFTDNSFVVLNDRSTIDLILEYNKNPYHRIIERGIHCAPFTEESWEEQQISDHKPYRVKVKIK